jgi:hypothetical protein
VDLSAKHKQAADELASAEKDFFDVVERVMDLEGDIKQARRNLAAILGDDEKRLTRLMESVEFQDYDPVKASDQIKKDLLRLRDLRQQRATAEARLETCRKAEYEAFLAVHTDRQKKAVAEAIRHEIALYHHLKDERAARDAVSGRQGRIVGSLPILARHEDEQFDIRDSQSVICHRIRQAVACSALTGDEPFLADVAWRNAGINLDQTKE